MSADPGAADERLREERTAHEEQTASEALLRPVRPLNAFEDTVERLLQTIRLGVLSPGESLPPERELAARLGVSRDTVREAIKSLADTGYLVSRRGRYGGTFLADALPAPRPDEARFSEAEITDAMRLREILEVGAARMAAGRTLTAADREALWSRLADVRGAAPEDYRRLDSRLHLAIAEAAGVPSLVPLVAQNRMRLNELLDCIPLLARNIAHSDEQHEAIVLAILAGDAERAAQTMTAHVWGSAALLHGFLD
jgi:DNA-binding FadR family transcriptional regulator